MYLLLNYMPKMVSLYNEIYDAIQKAKYSQQLMKRCTINSKYKMYIVRITFGLIVRGGSPTFRLQTVRLLTTRLQQFVSTTIRLHYYSSPLQFVSTAIRLHYFSSPLVSSPLVSSPLLFVSLLFVSNNSSPLLFVSRQFVSL